MFKYFVTVIRFSFSSWQSVQEVTFRTCMYLHYCLRAKYPFTPISSSASAVKAVVAFSFPLSPPVSVELPPLAPWSSSLTLLAVRAPSIWSTSVSSTKSSCQWWTWTKWTDSLDLGQASLLYPCPAWSQTGIACSIYCRSLLASSDLFWSSHLVEALAPLPTLDQMSL